jgi:hypothetical protein
MFLILSVYIESEIIKWSKDEYLFNQSSMQESADHHYSKNFTKSINFLKSIGKENEKENKNKSL